MPTNTAQATYYRTHPEECRAAQKRYNRKLRVQVVEVLGGRCARCGFDDERALQVDHINGDGADARRKLGSHRAVYLEVVAGDPGYQLLCANCNWIKRVEEGASGGSKPGDFKQGKL